MAAVIKMTLFARFIIGASAIARLSVAERKGQRLESAAPDVGFTPLGKRVASVRWTARLAFRLIIRMQW